MVKMFASILKFFGFTRKSGKRNSDLENIILNERIFKSIEDFKNRSNHSILTNELIDTISDDNLLQTVFDSLTKKLPRNYRDEFYTVTSWNNYQQAIYIIWVLEAEVNNGGFNQFYSNSSRQYAELAPEMLKFVGATKFSDLVTRANVVYENEYEKITRYQDGTLEGFSKSYKDNPLNKFDDEFYDLLNQENLQELQINFVRKNKSLFI